MKRAGLGILLFVCAFGARAADKLTIVKAGPIGEVASLAEANEIRVVFSEPMVVVGKIPKVLDVPWFHVEPAIKGSFRWSGTTTLIFTPDPKPPLPFATKYDVTVDAAAKAVSGKTLGKEYRFSFTTPTIQLLRTAWYRKGDKYDGGIVVALWFNQPVDSETLASHLQLRTAKHEIKAPELLARERLQKLEPQQVAAFDAKLAKAQQAAASDGQPVLSFFPTDWDSKHFSPAKELVVVETKPGVPPDTNLQVFIDDSLAKGNSSVATGRAQTLTIELNPTLFVDKLECVTECNPDYFNPISFRSHSGVPFLNFRKSVSVSDITDPAHETPVTPAAPKGEEREGAHATQYSLDELGYSLLPAHSYAIRIDPSLTTEDGQTLGYAWMGTVEYFHKVAFISFGDGHGVWESSGGPVLPFHARNFQNVTQWVTPLSLDQLVPSIVDLQKEGFHKTPATPGVQRKLAPVPDKLQSYGLNLKSSLSSIGNGIIRAAIQPGAPIPKSLRYTEDIAGTIVQVTNLGISVKDSPQNTLVLVSRLDNAAPVAGAKVSIRTRDNKVFWTGTTDASGIAVAPNTDLRVDRTKRAANGEEADQGAWEGVGGLYFIVTAEKDGDTAYVASDWNQGIQPWDFELHFDLTEARPLLRGTIFTDRGVYKPGEELHAKVVLRSDTPTAMQLLPAGTAADIVVTDSLAKEVDKRTVKLNDWSSAEWTWTVPAEAALGDYNVSATIASQRLMVNGQFLVAAYRRPEFRVDVTLKSPSSVAGTKLNGTIVGKYLFGAPMSARPVKWTYTKEPVLEVPHAISERFGEDQWQFLGEDAEQPRGMETIDTKEPKLDAKGEWKLTLDTDLKAGAPWNYTLEGNVTDISRQQIAGRTSFHVDPAPWYVGVKTPPYFADAAKGVDTAIVAVALNGTAAADVKVSVDLHRIQWNSVRESAGNGFYNWQTERKELPAGHFDVTTQATPVPLHVPLSGGGEYLIIAKATDAEGRSTTTRAGFYAVGSGYTAWARYDSNRIDLVPEKKTFRPGETARIMVKSPWEHATALLTTEREGVRTWKTFELTSTQTTVTVPITEKDIPNLYVSVLLLKGRTKDGIEDESDPGKPAFRLGYAAINVEDATKRLKVAVKANRDEYRPASKARIEVDVHDAAGKPSQSEVTLWAVDYGVLSLTGYETPDVLQSIYLEKGLQVVNEDSREKIVSRRVLTPKGETQGGGGGRDAGPGVIRKDFRVLAFWVGSVVTDNKGHARTDITLPESLTTYRIMAVAGDKASRFGWAQNEIRINKPVLLTPTWPRFLAVGDKAYFGAVVHSQLKQAGKATVTIKSLDPSVLEFAQPTSITIDAAAEGSAEVRFNATAKAIGNARLQMSVSLNGETDAFEDTLPVRILAPTETVAAYGEAKPDAKETLAVPKDVVPSAGGLHVELSSTAMVGLAEGASYLVDYPYGCAEQRSSAAMALMLASDLGDAFALPGIDAKKAHATAQKTIYELYKFQCGDGGFAYWAGECYSESPYLTANVLHVMQRGEKLQYDVNKDVTKRGFDYLDTKLKEKRPTNEGWWPAYTSWQAFAVKVLTEAGRNEDSHITRLYSYVDRMPLFGISYLLDAMVTKGEKGPRVDDLVRRLNNAILPEGGSAHAEELTDPYLLYFWNSNIRSTAITLGSLTRHGESEQLVKQMVRWLMNARVKGRWGNTQENVWAMESLVDYYRKYESETPDFTAIVKLGNDAIANDAFKGRSTVAKSHDVPMAQLQQQHPGAELPVTFDRQGTGTLFYLMRLRYSPSGLLHEGLDKGFNVERKYSQKTFKAGDLIKVTLRIRNTKERRFVAVSDPIPAGTEPVESWFATTATDLAEAQANNDAQGDDWMSWWQHGGFDHVERHDDHVSLFATRLSEGMHEFTYMVRATTAGTFITAPAYAEEMYEPEVFGRTASEVVEVKP
ncbi:MAG TPA: MG2 domain-containing protein [Thermoanaerobaculia bacterium]|nr:MG2 domain-containing protein [Thermoanaerobaculia bacterium]